jgi:hypothetical protein
MTDEDLARLTLRMLEVQAAYFDGPTEGGKKRAKVMERKVDEALRDLPRAGFAAVVNRARMAQREYFRTGSTSALRLAKALEKRARDAAIDVLNPQPTLFD